MNTEGEPHSADDGTKIVRVTTTATHILDTERYGPRTWKHDLKVFHVKPRWGEMLKFYKVAGQALCVPTILWLLCLNGIFLGVYVFHSSTFAQILLSPPYSFKVELLGFIQMGLIIANLFAVPLVGYGSDVAIKLMSRLRGGVYEVSLIRYLLDGKARGRVNVI